MPGEVVDAIVASVSTKWFESGHPFAAIDLIEVLSTPPRCNCIARDLFYGVRATRRKRRNALSHELFGPDVSVKHSRRRRPSGVVTTRVRRSKRDGLSPS